VTSAVSARGLSKRYDEFWALRDVSFDAEQGERLGIIGHNGAGKSTLLKLLSRVTEPSAGRAEIRGRVSSLLEVGTGFHPELSGRENVFLSGTILGMDVSEIQRKFDEIVAFAEIEPFIDTPVKRYSSGMYLRLAFSVAAHLEPEILILDEVLAVGDARFQEKCVRRMEAVSREQGRTILVVSHNLALIRQLCGRSMLLRQGRLEAIGATREVIGTYLDSGSGPAPGEHRWSGDARPGDEAARLESVRLASASGETCTEFAADEPVTLEVTYGTSQPAPGLRIGFALFTAEGDYLFYSADCDGQEQSAPRTAPGRYVSRTRIPGDLLNAGTFYVAVSGELPGVRTVLKGLPRLRFAVHPPQQGGARFRESRKGPLCPALKWEVLQR
jgi:lipopolysaccharide transport system ATP-binding protein